MAGYLTRFRTLAGHSIDMVRCHSDRLRSHPAAGLVASVVVDHVGYTDAKAVAEAFPDVPDLVPVVSTRRKGFVDSLADVLWHFERVMFVPYPKEHMEACRDAGDFEGYGVTRLTFHGTIDGWKGRFKKCIVIDGMELDAYVHIDMDALGEGLYGHFGVDHAILSLHPRNRPDRLFQVQEYRVYGRRKNYGRNIEVAVHSAAHGLGDEMKAAVLAVWGEPRSVHSDSGCVDMTYRSM